MLDSVNDSWPLFKTISGTLSNSQKFHFNLEAGEYMAFGLSGDSSRSKMVGGDVTVAWVDKDTLKGHAYDYFLDAKSQCSGGRGSCPDENISVSVYTLKK